MPSLQPPLLVANVVAMRSTHLGDYVYRVSQPSAAMGRVAGVKVVTVATVSPYLAEVCQHADLLILHLLTEDDLFPLLLERARRGLPTVYEVSDDFTASHQGVGIRGWFSSPTNRSNAFQLLRGVDGAQFTGVGLRDAFEAFNPNLAVFDNQVERMGRPPRAQGEAVRVGWAGSLGHTEDLREIAPVIASLVRRFPQVQFSFMGNRRQYDDVFGGLEAGRSSYTPPGTLERYYAFLEQLDVGLAPMLDNAFNRGRSDVKFVEYASRGVVPVLRALTPYLAHAVHGETAFLYRDNAELDAVLQRLVREPALRASVAQRAYGYVARERLEAQHVGDRLDFYEALGARPRGGLLPAQLRGEGRDGEAWDLPSRAEELLVAGIELESRGASQLAREHFEQARASAPGFDLPDFWLGRSYQLAGDRRRATEAFERALALNPRSMRAALFLAEVLATSHPARALGVLARAHEHAPFHAPTLEAMARVQATLGKSEQALGSYRAALSASPQFGRVATRLGQLYDERKETGLASIMFEHAAGLAPNDADTQVDVAEHLLAQGDVAKASEACVRALQLDGQNARGRALLTRLITPMEQLVRVA
jgi:tetratricopeptide (TPR) repeat protein